MKIKNCGDVYRIFSKYGYRVVYRPSGNYVYITDDFWFRLPGGNAFSLFLKGQCIATEKGIVVSLTQLCEPAKKLLENWVNFIKKSIN